MFFLIYCLTEQPCMWMSAVQSHLILHWCHIIPFLSPVDGVWKRPIAAEVVPFGGRAVLQKSTCQKPPTKNCLIIIAKCFLHEHHYLRLRHEEGLPKFTECHVWKLVQCHCRQRGNAVESTLGWTTWNTVNANTKRSYLWTSGFLHCVCQSSSCSLWISAVFGSTPSSCTLCCTVHGGRVLI